jgi:hypothetical protein
LLNVLEAGSPRSRHLRCFSKCEIRGKQKLFSRRRGSSAFMDTGSGSGVEEGDTDPRPSTQRTPFYNRKTNHLKQIFLRLLKKTAFPHRSADSGKIW